MASRRQILSALILLSTLLFFISGAYSQSAKDPQQDLSVTFSSRHEGTDPGVVFGVVRNDSANAYPCVRIEFDLSPGFDPRRPGEDARQISVLPVDLLNVQPRAARDY